MIQLQKIGLAETGAVRHNRVNAKIDMPKKGARGTTISLHDGNSKLNYITVMDSKPVYIVEETCEYYIEKFENAARRKRKNRSASSAGVNDEHKIIIYW